MRYQFGSCQIYHKGSLHMHNGRKNIYPLKNLYIRCAEKFSLASEEFCKKEDFLEIFQFTEQQFLINLLNVTFVNENQIRSNEFWQVIHSLEDAPMPYMDFAKDRVEFGSLSYLVDLFPEMHFMKSEKPDFVLKMDNKIIGLEVVSAGSNVEKQINKIANLQFGRNKRAEEVKNYIDKNHQNILGKYLFYNFNGIVALSPHKPFAKCEDLIERIIERICKKNKKSKKYTSYQDLWLLIDTEGNICFTDKHNADDLAKALNMVENDLNSFSKIIVISRLNNVHMIYDVASQDYSFHKKNAE